MLPTVAPESVRPYRPNFRSEYAWVGFLILVFLTTSFLVASRSPTVHMDETVFADPAANLYFGSGFTSTMWAQNRNELWSSQPPLYAGLLYVFFKVLGFGLAQARTANACIAAT